MSRFTVRDLMRHLRHGPYAWPGGYPTFFLASDGEMLSHATVRANLFQIARSTRDRSRDGWAVVGFDVYWEGPTVTDPEGVEIESAYGDPDEPEADNA